MSAPKTIVSPEYQLDLDRQPPQAAGCSTMGVLMVLGLFFLITGGGGMWVASRLSPPATPTATATHTPESAPPTDTPTPDDWGATGTIDYCWWVTPTATHTPTLVYTPDAWAATGTAIHEATHPPQTSTPTPDLPRAWCNNPPTSTPTATISATPLPTNTPPPTSTPTRALATVGYSGGGGGIYPPTVPPGWGILPTVSLIDLPTVPGTLTPTVTLTPSNIPSHLGSRNP